MINEHDLKILRIPIKESEEDLHSSEMAFNNRIRF